jgi:tRNA wybutosine-synthesizing protein 3
MSFKVLKQNFLCKLDKSKQGQVDRGVKPLIELINSFRDFFTTSSCSGRTVLLHLKGPRKNQTEWVFKSHQALRPDELWGAVREINAGPVWLKYEPFIVHVRCRTLACAGMLIRAARSAGLKKSGIIAAGSTCVVELEGSDRLEAPVYRGQILLPKTYFAVLTQEINKKIKNNKEKLKRLNSALECQHNHHNEE